MITDPHGQMIFSQADIQDLLMQGHDEAMFTGMLVDETVQEADQFLESMPWHIHHTTREFTRQEFDRQQQSRVKMPEEYQNLDIAAHVLSLCTSDAELQRVGEELLLYQERGMFDMLRWLKFLVDKLTSKNIIWGVGRGSSVASHVLYLLKVHRINALHYDLDPREFLR